MIYIYCRYTDMTDHRSNYYFEFEVENKVIQYRFYGLK